MPTQHKMSWTYSGHLYMNVTSAGRLQTPTEIDNGTALLSTNYMQLEYGKRDSSSIQFQQSLLESNRKAEKEERLIEINATSTARVSTVCVSGSPMLAFVEANTTCPQSNIWQVENRMKAIARFP